MRIHTLLNQLKEQEIEYTLEYGVQGTIVHYNEGSRFFAHFEEEETQPCFTVDNPDIKGI